jgi:hypothetical protein
MSRKTDKISGLIDPIYFNWIREAVIKHGKINIQALSEKFGILPGNTYFRNFIKDKSQDYIGTSGLNNILDECGYVLRLVPVKKDDIKTLTELENVTRTSFNEIRETVSDYAAAVKRAPTVVKKKGPKVVEKANLINSGIMGMIDEPDLPDVDDLFDDDELLVGTSHDEMPELAIDPVKLARKIAAGK